MKRFAIAAALMMSVSGLALAQTSAPPKSSPSAPPAASSTTQPSTTAGSGSSTQSAIHSEADVKQRLEHDGYSQVTDVKKDKDGYTAKAMKGGKQVSVDIEQNGKIQAK